MEGIVASRQQIYKRAFRNYNYHRCKVVLVPEKTAADLSVAVVAKESIADLLFSRS
jgi:hypothetical protein